MALSGIGELPLFKRRGSSTEEIEALLDLLPYPTIIADGRNARILLANAQATQLTAYTRREFAELQLSTLIPQIKTRELEQNSGAQSTHQLITRSSRSIQVKVRTVSLGGSDHWVAVSFLPAVEQEENSETLIQQRWEAARMLSLAGQQEDLNSALRQILQAGALLTAASHLALYLPIGKNDSLNLEAVSGSFAFPNGLQDTDLSHLRTPKVWQAGKPIESSLHRAANSAKLTYLASTPLDATNPGLGLLVVGESEKLAPKLLLTLLQNIATTTATVVVNARAKEKLQLQQLEKAGSEELRAALQENVQDGILFTDKNLNIIDLNPSAEVILGYTAAEALGRSANDILISAQPLLPSLEQVILDLASKDLGERKIHKRDGSEFLASVRIVPIQISENETRLAILFSDLSEHEAFHLQNQQLQQRAAIGEITAIFAHEVRNPINSISTGLQLMQINLAEDDPQQEPIKKLQEDVDRLEHRMKSVDAFSRNLEPHPEALDLGEFCRIQLDRWRPRMSRKHIQDHIQVAPETPQIFGDRRALDQVLTNLITNAIQAMEEQKDGILAIKVRPNPDDQSMVDLHISDSGPGIPEDIRRRIFEPFFTTKGHEGTGLGLAITRRIVMAHKGKIECESFPGGTLFKIQLPVAPPAAVEGNSA